MSDEIIYIDSRVVGFGAEPTRILATCLADTGHILVARKEPFILGNASQNVGNTVIVTDAPEYVTTWQLSFDAKENLDEAIAVYQQRKRAGLVEVDKNLTRFDPSQVLEVRKLDKNGLQQEFESNRVDNGHMAVLLAVWASARVAMHYSAHVDTDADHIDDSMLPFSI